MPCWTANYATYYENRKLWEAKGNVVVVKSDGKNLYTQQLFWNQQTKKIYSNVDSKIVQNDGRDVFIGEGFESDEEFKDWRFRRMKGRMEVEVKPTEQEVEVVPDSTAGRPDRGVGPVPARSPAKPPLHPPASLCPNPLSSPPSLRFRPGGRSQGCARQTGVRRGACRSPAQNGTAADEAGGI